MHLQHTLYKFSCVFLPHRFVLLNLCHKIPNQLSGVWYIKWCMIAPNASRVHCVTLLTYHVHGSFAVFLSVGLIYSTGEETALLVAVNSIFDHVTPEVYDDVIVVVVMSDSDQSTFLEYMHSEFSEYLQLGLLQVISPTESFYRAVDRGGINWEEEDFSEDFKRSITEFNKRLIFLLEYSAHISEFYLQLSSFSRVSTHFLPIIKGTLNANGNASFAFGNFNQRGILSLGALYPSSVLSEVAEFGAMFPSGRLPCEIFNTFFYIRVSNDKVLATKDLFWFMKEKQGHKPDVEFHSSIESESQFEVEKAYLEEAGYHWAIRPKAGQNLVMTFKTPVRLSRVLITSGTPFFRDVLKAGVVKACEAGSGPLDCDHSKCVDIGRVVDTVVDVGGLEGSLSFPVKCLQLVIEKDHHSWVIIRDISVWIRS